MSPVDTSAPSLTWTFVDGHWLEGNPGLMGPRSHAFWLGSYVFDGARWFEGVAPDLDLHCTRVNRSALSMGLTPTMNPETIEHLTHAGRPGFDAICAVPLRIADDCAIRLFANRLALPPPDAGNHADRCEGRLPLSEQCTRRSRSPLARF
jgi:hypothetical protein